MSLNSSQSIPLHYPVLGAKLVKHNQTRTKPRSILAVPVKGGSLISEKVLEYHHKDKIPWPCGEVLGDVLRAMIICSNGDLVRDTWEELQISDGG